MDDEQSDLQALLVLIRRVGRRHRLLSATIIVALLAVLFLPPSTPAPIGLAAVFVLLGGLLRFSMHVETADWDRKEMSVTALLRERTDLSAAEAEELAGDIRELTEQ